MRSVLLLLAVSAGTALAQPPSVTIRPATGTPRTLPVERDSAGERFVRADRLAEALRGTFGFTNGSPYRGRMRIADVALDFVADAPFVVIAGETVPMAAAPRLDGDRFLVPLDVVSDVIPRGASGFIFDVERGELRAFPRTTPRTRAAATAAAPAAAPPAPRGDAEAPPVQKTPPEPEPAAVTPGTGARARMIVVDAGHGGVDGGMRGTPNGAPVVREKDVTLAIARRLRETLQARGMGVVLTRTRDTLIALADRGRIANTQHGDLFVSIHVNAANPKWRDAAAARGFETYFLADAKSEDARRVAELENESEQYETKGPNASSDPLGFILSDMAQNAHLREASRLAALVQRRLGRVHPGTNRGVKQAGFKVLVTASMPAILVEVGYGSNAADAEYITSDKGQRAIAAAIADAAAEYFGVVSPSEDSMPGATR